MTEIATNTTVLQNVLTKALTEEWKAQGHAMTSSITENIEYVVKQEVNVLTLSGMIYFYGNILAAGTPASKIPYSGRTGAGGKSLYITALQNYVKARMKITDEKKSKSIAFAIATEQKKHGMPTPGSYKYTKTGKRTEWVEDAFKKSEDKIFEAIRDMTYNLLSVKIDVLINKWNIELNK